MFEVKYITYTQYYGGELSYDDEIVFEFDNEEKAKAFAKTHREGCRGQFVEVYVNDKYIREYKA